MRILQIPSQYCITHHLIIIFININIQPTINILLLLLIKHFRQSTSQIKQTTLLALYFSMQQSSSQKKNSSNIIKKNSKVSMQRPKLIVVWLHLFMIVLCLVGSIIFLQSSHEWFMEQQSYGNQSVFSQGFQEQNKIESKKQLLTAFIMERIVYLLTFLKKVVIIPLFILSYVYYCIKNNIFYYLLKKQRYQQLYSKKYGKSYKIFNTNKGFAEQINENQFGKAKIVDNNNATQTYRKNNFYSYNDRNNQNENSQQVIPEALNKSANSSFNMSVQIVRSMSKSMLGSFKSMANGSQIGNTLMKSFSDQKGNNSSKNVNNMSSSNLRSTKMIAHLNKKTHSDESFGKGLGELLQKVSQRKSRDSQNYLNTSNVSSSGFGSNDQSRIKISSKRFSQLQYENSQYEEYEKEQNIMKTQFFETLKKQNLNQKTLEHHSLLLIKGLQKQIHKFLQQFKQNTLLIAQNLQKYYYVSIENYEDSKKSKSSQNNLGKLFESEKKTNYSNRSDSSENKRTKQSNNISSLQECESMNLQKILDNISSSNQFFYQIKSVLKLSIRNKYDEKVAQAILKNIILSRLSLTQILNISPSKQLDYKQAQLRIKLLQLFLKKISSNYDKQIFSPEIFTSNSAQIELLQSQNIDNIKSLVDIRNQVLLFMVNKVNSYCSGKNKQQNALKYHILMKQSVTSRHNEGGILSILTGTQKKLNDRFAEIICKKGSDQLISHHDFKIKSWIAQSESPQEQSKNAVPEVIQYHSQPGINNSLSVILLLCKKYQDYFASQPYKFESNYNIIKQEDKLKYFINTLYPVVRI